MCTIVRKSWNNWWLSSISPLENGPMCWSSFQRGDVDEKVASSCPAHCIRSLSQLLPFFQWFRMMHFFGDRTLFFGWVPNRGPIMVILASVSVFTFLVIIIVLFMLNEQLIISYYIYIHGNHQLAIIIIDGLIHTQHQWLQVAPKLLVRTGVDPRGALSGRRPSTKTFGFPKNNSFSVSI